MSSSDDDIDRQVLVEIFDGSYEIMTVRQLDRIQNRSEPLDFRVVGYCDKLATKNEENNG